MGCLTKKLVEEITDIYLMDGYTDMEQAVRNKFYARDITDRLTALKNGLVMLQIN